MLNNRSKLAGLTAVLCTVAITPGFALAEDTSLADIQSGSITWGVPSSYAEAELFVGGVAGSVSLLFEDGENISYTGQAENGGQLPDGIYSYSLSLVPQEVADDKAALAAAYEANNEAEVERLSNRLQEASDYTYHQESGEFQIVTGAIEPYDAEAEQAEAQAAQEAEEALADAAGEET